MSIRKGKTAVAHQTENNLLKAQEMLTKAGYSFINKNNALQVTDIPVTVYYDSIGGKFIVISTKEGTELHENKFIGGVKNFIDRLKEKQGVDSNTTATVETKDLAPDKSKRITVRTPSLKKGVSKMSIAAPIFEKMYGKKSRKVILAEFVSKAGLTKPGASTYYQNFVRKSVK